MHEANCWSGTSWGKDPAWGGAIWPLHGAAWRTYGDCICPHSPAGTGEKKRCVQKGENKLAGDAQGVFSREDVRLEIRRIRWEETGGIKSGIAGRVTMSSPPSQTRHLRAPVVHSDLCPRHSPSSALGACKRALPQPRTKKAKTPPAFIEAPCGALVLGANRKD